MLLTQVKQYICADFSQGNTKKCRQNLGKQCGHEITNINVWDSSFLNVIIYCVLEIAFILV